MDDEHEAVEYINSYVKNSTAFVMDVGQDEVEQDCTPLNGSNSLYEYRYCTTRRKSEMLTIRWCRFEGNEGEVMV